MPHTMYQATDCNATEIPEKYTKIQKRTTNNRLNKLNKLALVTNMTKKHTYKNLKPKHKTL